MLQGGDALGSTWIGQEAEGVGNRVRTFIVVSQAKTRQSKAGYAGLALASMYNFSGSGVWDCLLSGTWLWGD